jgi:uncharacterized metal-binding protein YceD (DUF177 family)
MDDTFKIFVGRLKVEHEERIEEILSPDFLDIQEAELAFQAPVYLRGIADVADEMFVLRLVIETELIMPCAICNQGTAIKISIPDFYYTEALAEIKGGLFDYRDILREAILLEIPYTAECNSGHCPERAAMAKYFTKND